ncbi:hypothetical protein [Streptomyces sp. 184]|uniref:hypothetical protein n=1 Tax=Streptomyces sp. 184 TaxID=1827526 RepID=UPI003891EAA3
MPELTEAEEERLRRALGLIAAEAVVREEEEPDTAGGRVGRDVGRRGRVVPLGRDAPHGDAPHGDVPHGDARRGDVPRGEDAARGEDAPREGRGWGEPLPSPSAAGRRLRRGVAVVVSAAAVAAFGLLAHTAITGAGTDGIAQDGAGNSDADGQGLTLLENAACTKRLLEGTVADVKQVPRPPDAFPWVEVTLTDVRWHVPPSSETRTTVRIPDPVEWNDEKPFVRGEPLLVEDLGGDDIAYYRGARGNPYKGMGTVREERLRALEKAQEKGITCPSFWVNR